MKLSGEHADKIVPGFFAVNWHGSLQRQLQNSTSKRLNVIGYFGALGR
jgi:hypothetical protein